MARLTEFVELSRQDIEMMAGEFGLQDIDEITPLAGGIINTNYRLRTARGDFLLRLCPQERTAEALRFELSTLAHLAADGFPAPRPVVSPLGHDAGYSERYQRRFVVFEFIHGRALSREKINTHIAAQVGDLFGGMQTRLAGFVPAGSKPSADIDYIAALKDDVLAKLSEGGAAGETLAEELLVRWNDAYARLAQRKFVSGVVHADLYYGNVIVREGRVVGIIDFDDSYLGSLTMDLAVVLMEFAFVERDRFDLSIAGELLTAYAKRCQSGLDEWDGLGDCMTCACYKYLGYTSALEHHGGEQLSDNEYITRIFHVTEPGFRSELERLLRNCRRITAG